MNTQFDYMYRDGGNCKKHGSMVLSGQITPKLEKRFTDTLDHEFMIGQFIAAQVGVPEVFLWKGDWPANTEDHEWHEAGDFTVTNDEPTDARSIEEFVNAFEAAAATGWDPSLSRLPSYEERCACLEEVETSA